MIFEAIFKRFKNHFKIKFKFTKNAKLEISNFALATNKYLSLLCTCNVGTNFFILNTIIQMADTPAVDTKLLGISLPKIEVTIQHEVDYKQLRNLGVILLGVSFAFALMLRFFSSLIK